MTFKNFKPTDLVKCHVCKEKKMFVNIKDDMKDYKERVSKNPFGTKTPKKISTSITRSTTSNISMK